MKQETFGKAWASILWTAMTKSGKGYRRPSMKNDGIKDKRGDKTTDDKGNAGEFVGWQKNLRSYCKRYSRA